MQAAGTDLGPAAARQAAWSVLSGAALQLSPLRARASAGEALHLSIACLCVICALLLPAAIPAPQPLTQKGHAQPAASKQSGLTHNLSRPSEDLTRQRSLQS